MKPFLLPLILLLCAFKVHDGDTITRISYRLAYIDAPEIDQTCNTNDTEIAIGEESQAYLEKKVGKNLSRCVHVATDRYGREVVDCGINLEMVRAGMALCYDKYIHNGFMKARCHHLQKRAKNEKAGLWQCKDFVTPGDYRKSKKG